MDRDMYICEQSVLDFIGESYSNVLEYSADKRYAYLQDEDSDDGTLRIPVALVRDLIAREQIKVWRYMGGGYNTYKPAWWVAAWVREHGPITIDVPPVRLALPEPKGVQ